MYVSLKKFIDCILKAHRGCRALRIVIVPRAEKDKFDRFNCPVIGCLLDMGKEKRKLNYEDIIQLFREEVIITFAESRDKKLAVEQAANILVVPDTHLKVSEVKGERIEYYESYIATYKTSKVIDDFVSEYLMHEPQLRYDDDALADYE